MSRVLRLSAVVAWLGLAAGRLGAEPLEVEVVGGAVPRSAREPGVAATVIRGEELERAGADATDALERVPGVQIVRSGTNSDLATASIRGATSAETPVYLAGVRLNDELTGTADLSTIPLWMLDRVEVFRGNAPADVDRLGLGGAILFEPKLPSGQRVGAGVQLGSFGERGGFVGAMTGDRANGALISLRTEHADNDFEYLSDQGLSLSPVSVRETRRNADATSRDAWAVSRLAVGDGRVVTLLNAFEREQGEPGLGAAGTARRSRSRTQRLLGALSARAPCSSGPGGACELELVTTLLSARSSITDPAREIALGTTAVSSAGRRVAQTARIRLWPEAGPSVQGALGQELEQLDIERAGSPRLALRRSVTRAALSGRLPLGSRWELSAVGAVACNTTSSSESGRGQRCDPLVPEARAGARLALAERAELLANVGRYVRVPTLGELYGVAPLVRGNAGLANESGYSADAGARVEARRRDLSWWAESFVFARLSRDLITYRRAAPGYVRPYNTGRARTLGLELAAGAVLFDHLSSRTSLSLLEPRDTTPGRTLENDLLPHKSRLVLAQGVEGFARRPFAGGPLDRAALGADLQYRSSSVADPAGLNVIPEQLGVDVHATLVLARDRLTVRAAVENVFDARHQDLLNLPLPGRSWHTSVSAWW